MNKYEKAFNHLREHASFDTVDEMIDIKELVEKSMKNTVMSFGFVLIVKKITMRKDEHCFNCGQALDWK